MSLKMISVVALLCFVAATSAIPVPSDYYPKFQRYGGGHGFNGGIIGINDNGFESSIFGLNDGNSAAGAAASAASGMNSAAAAADNAASGGSRHFGQQGVLGFNNGFDAEFGFNGGNSAAASAAAAASGMNSAAAAAAASTAQRSSFSGFQGHSGHHLTSSNYGPFVHQVPSVQFPAVQQFNGLGGSAAAAASASGANFGFPIGIGGSHFSSQIGSQFIQPAAYYPNVPFVGQNSGAAAAAAAASVNGFNGGIGGSTSFIRPQIVRGKKY